MKQRERNKAHVGRFTNIRNDCFSISLIHVFINSSVFRDYLDKHTKNQLERLKMTKVFKEFLKGFIKNPDVLPEKGDEAGFFWKEKEVIEQPMDPKELLKLLPAHNNNAQEDMMIVLRLVINELAYEEMTKENQGALVPTEASGENNDPEVVIARHIGNSKIKKMFMWILEITFNCPLEDCEKKNPFYDAQTDLQVMIPGSEASRHDRNIKHCLPRSPAFLLENFEKECTECKRHVKTTAKSTVYKSPDIGILVITRNDGTGTTNKKSDTLVHFPKMWCFENMDLEDSEIEKPENKHLIKHELQVIINHLSAVIDAGHYTTYVKDQENGQWFLSNDDIVTKIEKKEIKTKDSRESSYCFVYYKEYSGSTDAASVIETVVVEDIENTQPGPSTDNISSDKGNIGSLLLSN